MSKGHYQYAVFDEDGNKKSIHTGSLRRAIETKKIWKTFNFNEGNKLIVKKRLVMEWEQVEDCEEE